MKGAANKDEPQHMALCGELPYCFQTHVSECVRVYECVCTLRIEVISNKAVAAARSVQGRAPVEWAKRATKVCGKAKTFCQAFSMIIYV